MLEVKTNGNVGASCVVSSHSSSLRGAAGQPPPSRAWVLGDLAQRLASGEGATWRGRPTGSTEAQRDTVIHAPPTDELFAGFIERSRE
jgi:hypothetical protein